MALKRAKATAAQRRGGQEDGGGKKQPGLIIDCKYDNELPKPPVPKLLKALPSVERLCKYTPSQLELDCRPFLLTERELLTRLEVFDPEAYGEAPAKGSMGPPPPPQDAQLLRDDDVSEEVKETERKRRRLTERTEASHRQAFGLQLPQLITNDVFTERQRFTTGREAAEKKLTREPPGYNSMEELASKIEKTFEATKEAPVHPSKPSLRPKRILDVVPDAVLWANRYRQVTFDEMPKGGKGEPVRDDLLFKTNPTPRLTCFGFFAPATEGEPGTYRVAQNYFWDNRGGFTKEQECGEGEAMLISMPNSDDPKGEARFVSVPSYMRLRKQKALRLDISLETKVLNVTHRDPSAQEAAEEQERMNVVLSDDVPADKSEASLDFVDGEWQIRGDPRSASGRSKMDAASGEQGGGSLRALPLAGGSPASRGSGSRPGSRAGSVPASPQR